MVTDGGTPEPKIESITPVRVPRGAIVTVKGSGFLAQKNMVRTGVNIFENVYSSDRTSLSFVVPIGVLTATTSMSAKKTSFPVWVFIVNENGVSNGKSFDLEL